jgi:hypothetical protein
MTGAAVYDELERRFRGLPEDLRSILAIHVDNRADVPRILNLVLTAIGQRVVSVPACETINNREDQ